MTSASASSISDSRPWLERFIWSFGSPNLCTSGELCNWHKDFTHALTFGRGISTPDYANTSLAVRSEEHTSELQSLMRISYAVFCLKNTIHYHTPQTT